MALKYINCISYFFKIKMDDVMYWWNFNTLNKFDYIFIKIYQDEVASKS